MPELPEVETIKRQVVDIIKNKHITDIVINNNKLRKIINIPNGFVINEPCMEIHRRNKYLIIETNSYWLVIHLGMTGTLRLNNQTHQSHDQVLIHFSDCPTLILNDPRRFGLFMVYNKAQYQYNQLPETEDLGFEPLDPNFTQSSFNKLYKMKKEMNIKNFLMDGHCVCGIGNIYASEILFDTKIYPLAKIKDIDESVMKSIYPSIRKILKKAIEQGGSSISDFKNVYGSSGNMQNYHKVYNKENLNCVICNNKILKITQSGRSTFYCPTCQTNGLLNNNRSK